MCMASFSHYAGISATITMRAAAHNGAYDYMDGMFSPLSSPAVVASSNVNEAAAAKRSTMNGNGPPF